MPGPKRTLRDRIYDISPTWLRSGVDERKMYGFGLAEDGIVDKMSQGGLARFPTRAQPDANTVTGRDRGIMQGLTESDASFAVRLQRVFESYQFAGAARSTLGQLLGYLLAVTPTVREVSNYFNQNTYPLLNESTSWDSYPAGRDPGAEPVHVYALAGDPGGWDWDRFSAVTGSYGWWATWIILFSVAPNAWANPATWAIGDAGLTIGTLPGSIGLDVVANVLASIRSIVGQFGRAGTWKRYIIVSFSGTLFDPTHTAGGGVNPDGHFGRWSKTIGGARIASRFANARYCEGVF